MGPIGPRRRPSYGSLIQLPTRVAFRSTGSSGPPVCRQDPPAVWAVIMIVIDVSLLRLLFCDRVVGGNSHFHTSRAHSKVVSPAPKS